MSVRGPRIGLWGSLAVASAALPATGQFYTFTSGPSGDGFSWPASPPGLLSSSDTGVFEEFSFTTPDGVEIQNYTGNNAFFDSQYQVASNSGLISGDALWGNPTFDDFGSLDFFTDNFGSGGVQTIEFDYAQAVSGGFTPDSIDIYIEDSDGRFTFESYFLGNDFSGFGGFQGKADTIFLDASSLFDQGGDFEGDDQFIDISYFYVDFDSTGITSGGGTNEFAIDNLSIDGGSGGGPDEVFPSFNQGTIDATNTTSSSNSLRGVGTFDVGIEVTNGGPSSTTYSVELVPGGDLTAGSLPSGAPIGAGQSIFTPGVASIDRSLPSGTYESDFNVVNDGDPSDPDNLTTKGVDLYEPQLLSGNFASVNVNNFEDVTLANAAAPANGFRAAVKAIGAATTTGPFNVDAWAADTRVLDGDTIMANVTFDRFGQLSGTYNGTHVASFEQAAYVVNQFVDFEVFLANKETVPNQVWNLTYTHVNATTDFGNFSPGGSFNKRIGINTFDVAATLIDGTSSKNQQASLQFMSNPNGNSADLIGDAADLVFSGSVDDIFVLQLTYEPLAVPAGATEDDLRLLWYDANAGEWANAVDGNTGGTPTLFAGSYADFLAGPGSGSLDAGDLGYYGLDTVNNHVWAVLDHASLFGVGVLSAGVITGDYDSSGQVEQGDLDIVLQNWGTGNFTGDPNALVGGGPFDGQVDQNELDGVLQNWGSTSAPSFAGSTVPEPAGALALLALTGMALRRR